MPTGGRRRRRGGASRPKAKKKRKRTKYLSLSRIIVKAEEEVQTPPPEDDGGPRAREEEAGQQQADPFAPHHDASALFASSPAPSLSDILGSPSPPSASSDGVSGAAAAEGQDLARRALRGRERWVYRGSGASSSSSSAASTGAPPLLKLDYREILAAWAGRGSLYIGGGPKREPEPDLDTVVLVETEPPPRQQAAGTERAERVRRYREKRFSRLFAKRIRYEVRRLNAVRRPRFKGRFTKEHEEVEVEPT